MSQQALLVEAHHTTHIEGTQLTLEQAERLWAGQAVDEARADDVRELLNYRGAFNLVSEYLGGGEPITEGLIREIHKRLVDGVRGGAGDPGRYRTVQNYVANSRTREIIYTPPPPGQVAPLVRELVEWLRAETDIHPVLVAGIAQFQLVHILQREWSAVLDAASRAEAAVHADPRTADRSRAELGRTGSDPGDH